MSDEYKTTPGSLELLHPVMEHNDNQEQEWNNEETIQVEQSTT